MNRTKEEKNQVSTSEPHSRVSDITGMRKVAHFPHCPSFSWPPTWNGEFHSKMVSGNVWDYALLSPLTSYLGGKDNKHRVLFGSKGSSPERKSRSYRLESLSKAGQQRGGPRSSSKASTPTQLIWPLGSPPFTSQGLPDSWF